MQRCWLKGAEGDALQAVLCAAGFNIRWLLRAIARLDIARIFCALNFAGLLAAIWCVARLLTAQFPLPDDRSRLGGHASGRALSLTTAK